ncbi:MAG: transporter substrate-binding domain-containing protein [Magnetococcales bacterium]|nr:transporter substrate-binding domain-containing protein [Magnetococcales bacterium]
MIRQMRNTLLFLMAVLSIGCTLFLTVFPVQAETSTNTPPLRVGINSVPPFVIQLPDGSYEGISIDLWKHIATELDLDYTFVETDLTGLIKNISEKNIDIATAALTITANREKKFDFSHPFFQTGYGVAIRTEGSNGLIDFFERLVSMEFIKAISALTVLLLLTGILIWLFERKRNAAQFDSRPLQGIGSGFWWSAVTMTTVGYGDKSPITFGGRLLALIWMFVGLITISTFTAAITTALTETRSSSIEFETIADLNKVRVGTIKDSSSESFLSHHLVRFRTINQRNQILPALQHKQFDAFVYDEPILQYLIDQAPTDTFTILPGFFGRQDYGFAFPEGSPLREQVNRVLLSILATNDWLRIQNRYLGTTNVDRL